jgi:PAS domain S-box-containing protein
VTFYETINKELRKEIDIRKQAESALRESEQRMRTILDASPDMIFQVNTDFRIIWANKVCREMNPKAIGSFCYKEYPGKGEICEGCPCYAALKTNRTTKGIIYHPSIEGLQGENYWENIGIPLRDDQGMVIGAIEIARNITEQKQREEKIRNQHEFLQLLIDAIPISIYYKDTNGIYLGCNDTYADFLGKPKGYIIRKGVYEVFPKDLADKYHEMDEWLFKKPGVQQYEGQMNHSDGTRHDVLFNKATYEDENGKAIGLIGAMLDITDKKKALIEKEKLEAQLRQALKMEAVGTLARGIAHDFNNILAIILGFAEMITDDIPEWSPARNNIEEVIKATHRAKDLVKQILTFSRSSDQKLRPLQIQPVIKEAIKFLRATFPTTVDIKQNISSKCGAILGDPTQIHQLLLNICTNAVHAMQERGIISISLKEENLKTEDFVNKPGMKPGAYVKLTVSDTGEGMDQATLERIFDPFFTTKEVGKGTGLVSRQLSSVG